MSDQNGAGQTRPTALPIVINAQYVKDFSFENPNAPQTLLPGQPAPQVSVGVDVRSQQVGETLYEVVLEMRCEAKIGENTAFLVELSYAGLFTLTGPCRRAYQAGPADRRPAPAVPLRPRHRRRCDP